MEKTRLRAAADGRNPKLSDTIKNSIPYKILYEKGILYFCLSFFIPAVIMLMAFKKELIHPFGDNQMLVVDLWHQYFPFFRVVREKLITGGSFLYSWENGLGTNFLSLISYYAASPLNWISVFFSDDGVRDAMTFILIGKIGFCGAFFSCFLRYTYRRTDFSICIFSSMFALCSYMLGYYWNVMWFDTVALFPLVMLGVVAICRERKWRTFTIALALSLISNYYIGYFTCIFTMFMFAAAIIIYARGIKDFFYKIWLIIRSSVLGIALGGFMLLPAYFGLQQTYSVENTFPKDMTFYEKWTDIFANMFSYSTPAMKEGLPNFACGMLALVLFGVFLFSFGIKIREKISALVMLAVIAVSCNMNILNYIWHGFHFTNMIPYRFAFIFPFVLVAAAFRGYDAIMKSGIKIYQLPLLVIGPAAVLGLKYYNTVKRDGKEFIIDDNMKQALIIAGAMVLIFVAAKLFPFKRAWLRTGAVNIALAVAVCIELYGNALIGVQTVGHSSYSGYPANQNSVQALLDTAAENEKDNPFYRTETASTYTLNDSALYGYNGISQFSSAANVSVTRFMQSMGLYASEAGNRYYYRLSTPVLNTMLGVKYIISKTGHIFSDKPALTELASESNVHLYKNEYPLSLGYMVSSDVWQISVSDYSSPIEYQNDVLKLSADIQKDCFIPQPVKYVSYDEMDVVKRAYGEYSFSKTKDTAASSTYTYDGVEGCYLYGYASNGGCGTVDVTNNGQTVESGIKIEDYPVTFPLGNAQEGETAEVRINALNERVSGSYDLKVYAMDMEVFEEAYSRLADEQLDITSFSDTEIKGTVRAENDGILLLSMPYEKGWSVTVDGQPTKTKKIFGALLGAEVPGGEHEIVLKYVPEGFTAGVAATGGSLLICGVIAFLDRRKQRLAEEEADDADGEDSPEDTEENNTEAVTEADTAEGSADGRAEENASAEDTETSGETDEGETDRNEES